MFVGIFACLTKVPDFRFWPPACDFLPVPASKFTKIGRRSGTLIRQTRVSLYFVCEYKQFLQNRQSSAVFPLWKHQKIAAEGFVNRVSVTDNLLVGQIVREDPKQSTVRSLQLNVSQKKRHTHIMF